MAERDFRGHLRHGTSETKELFLWGRHQLDGERIASAGRLHVADGDVHVGDEADAVVRQAVCVELGEGDLTKMLKYFFCLVCSPDVAVAVKS